MPEESKSRKAPELALRCTYRPERRVANPKRKGQVAAATQSQEQRGIVLEALGSRPRVGRQGSHRIGRRKQHALRTEGQPEKRVWLANPSG